MAAAAGRRLRTSAVKSADGRDVGCCLPKRAFTQPDLRWHAEHDWVRLWMMSSRPAISVLSSVDPVRGALEWWHGRHGGDRGQAADRWAAAELADAPISRAAGVFRSRAGSCG